MSHKQFVFQFLKKAKRRLSLAILADVMVKALAAGLGVGAAINIAALLFPIYGAFAASLAALGMVLLLGFIYAAIHFPDDRRAALEVDKRGLEERLTTFVELEKTQSSPEWSELQTEDTYRAVKNYDLKANIPVKVSRKPVYCLIGMMVLFAVAAVLPSPNKDLAIANHQQKEKAEAEIEKIEKAEEQIEELKKMEELTEAELSEIEKLQDILEKAREELSEAGTQEELEKALERMETKTLQKLSENSMAAGENKASKLKKQIEEFLKKAENQSKEKFTPEELADILDAKTLEALKEELEEAMGELSDAELTELLEELEGSLSEGSLSKEQLEQLAEAMENYTPSDATAGQLAQIMEGTLGVSIPSNQSASSQNGQSGNGNGNGNGTGSGNGTGQGSGQGGSGIGGGKNQGSKNGIEKENNRMEKDEQITIPGRETGDDENLTGQSGEGDSYQTAGGEGLTWSGEKVNYDQVIGEYTEEAYQRVENNQVPKGMEDIVKSYFEEINQ